VQGIYAANISWRLISDQRFALRTPIKIEDLANQGRIGNATVSASNCQNLFLANSQTGELSMGQQARD
jgi:hypothetical protein